MHISNIKKIPSSFSEPTSLSRLNDPCLIARFNCYIPPMVCHKTDESLCTDAANNLSSNQNNPK